MKKYLSTVAAILTVISLTGCAANSGTNGAEGGTPGITNTDEYVGTDIGGRKPSGGGFLDKITDGFKGGTFFEAETMTADAPIAGMTGADGEAAASADVAAPGAIGGDDAAFGRTDIMPIEPIEPVKPQPEPQAGMLTGGEWNDNAHWSDWEALYSSHEDWNQYKKTWDNPIDKRIAVKVTTNGQPLEGAKVSCKTAISSAVTDNKGMAYLFYTSIDGATDEIVVNFNGTSKTLDGVTGNASVECEFGTVNVDVNVHGLDFMIMCDTTGSMSDELEYLKVELENIVRKVSKENPNTNIRTLSLIHI